MQKIKILTLLLLLFFMGSTTAVAQQGVPDDPRDVSPVLIGAEVPDVALRNHQGEAISLRDLVAEKPTVFVFYRGGWCPYCSRQLGGMQAIEDQILAAGYQIVGISMDRPEELAKSIEKGSLSYTLLSDSDASAVKAFGIAFRLDDGTVTRYKRANLDLAAVSGYDHQILPVPSIFLVNTDGVITFTYINPDYRVRLSAEVLLAAVQSL